MTDGPQQHEEHPGADDEFAPKPGQPTMPFRAVIPPAEQWPGARQDQPQEPGYGYPGQPQQDRPAQPLPHPGYGYPPQDPAAAPQPQQPGYGFPPQSPPPAGRQPGYGFPQQPSQPSGHGFPQQPGAAWTPPAAPIGTARPGGEPDWSALAERRAHEGTKRRKLFLIGGGALAVVVIGAIVATAVVVTGHKKPVTSPTAAPTDPAIPVPSPTFSDASPTPPPSALTVISNAATDKAPVTAAGLFPGDRFTFSGRAYAKTALASTTYCAGAGAAGLPAVLARYGCHQMVRATYTRDGIAVTVGVAVFDNATEAQHVKQAAGPYVLPLAGGGIGHAFCHSTPCRSSTNAVGRYAYFTIAGRVDGGAVTATDTATGNAADDIGTLTFRRLLARGQQPTGGQ
ncbi:hypothetical protein [Streptantibioticus silvisoli]|uniref:Uncharacterized protein n=1 Tax=Streptantibioticus silvisoli TaxID=2705255 RepID=A0ABT6W317_9ACTN|nr:hypothetical protein [Streptantibioticus silvisoli]MDI5965131.1 hypothetical protein [Streptantibioticus silvisoli]